MNLESAQRGWWRTTLVEQRGRAPARASDYIKMLCPGLTRARNTDKFSNVVRRRVRLGRSPLSLLGLQRRLLAVLASAQVEVTLAIAWGMGLATHFEEALATAEPYLERPSADTWITNVVPNVVRLGRLKGGHREALCATPWMPYPIEERRRNLYSSIYRLCLLGHAQRWNSCNLSLPSGISRIRCDWPNDMPVPIRSR